MPSRRLLFGMLPVVLLLAVAEGLGRGAPSELDSTLARLYEPGTVLVAEEGSTRRTAHTELHPQAWEMPAPGFRVAFVGDSTAWGQLPDAFVQGLQAPGQDVEVLNFAMRGAASLRVRVQAEAAVAQDLDLLVVYVGHNEVTEGRLNPFSLEPYWKRRLIATIGRTGLARQMGPLLRPLRRRLELRTEVLRRPGELAIRPLSPEEWAPVADAYRANLEGICALADGVPIVFVAPISSLVHPGEVATDPTPAYREALQGGYEALRQGAPEEARSWVETLARAYGTSGPARALRGLVWLALERREEAIAELRAARRLDGQPSRATEDHHAIVREVARGCGARFVDPEPAFLADPRYLDLADPLLTASTPRSPGTCSWPGSSPKRRRSRRAAPGTPLA